MHTTLIAKCLVIQHSWCDPLCKAYCREYEKDVFDFIYVYCSFVYFLSLNYTETISGTSRYSLNRSNPVNALLYTEAYVVVYM